MRIAISTDGDVVSQHFGRCPNFTIVDIENNEIKRKETVENPGHNPGFLPKFLKEKSVNCIVAGGMGQMAIQLFSDEGIEVRVGVSGLINDVVEKIAGDVLVAGESSCKPGDGKGYGLDKTECDHPNDDSNHEGGC